MAALTTWPALMPPSLVAPKRTEPEGRTRTGSAHRISRDSNSDATKLSNTAPGLLHRASPVTSSNGEFEARRCVMVVNPGQPAGSRHGPRPGDRGVLVGCQGLRSVQLRRDPRRVAPRRTHHTRTAHCRRGRCLGRGRLGRATFRPSQECSSRHPRLCDQRSILVSRRPQLGAAGRLRPTSSCD